MSNLLKESFSSKKSAYLLMSPGNFSYFLTAGESYNLEDVRKLAQIVENIKTAEQRWLLLHRIIDKGLEIVLKDGSHTTQTSNFASKDEETPKVLTTTIEKVLTDEVLAKNDNLVKRIKEIKALCDNENDDESFNENVSNLALHGSLEENVSDKEARASNVSGSENSFITALNEGSDVEEVLEQNEETEEYEMNFERESEEKSNDDYKNEFIINQLDNALFSDDDKSTISKHESEISDIDRFELRMKQNVQSTPFSTPSKSVAPTNPISPLKSSMSLSPNSTLRPSFSKSTNSDKSISPVGVSHIFEEGEICSEINYLQGSCNKSSVARSLASELWKECQAFINKSMTSPSKAGLTQQK